MTDYEDTPTVSQLKTASPQDEGKPFSTVVLYLKSAARTGRTGVSFLNVEFGDKSGSFNANLFEDSPARQALEGVDPGAVLRVDGNIEHYQGRFSPKIMRVSVLDDTTIREQNLLDRLVACAPEDAGQLWEELNGFIDGIADPGLRDTVKQLMTDHGERFRICPAAVSMHHAYRNGLLEHSVHMARACAALLPLYPQVHPSLAMAGVIVHDIGKTVEYQGDLAPKRSRKGILQGHVVLGYRLVRQAAIKAKLDSDLLERLEHIVLSHQGELEWGAAAMAATPEAVFVSMIDNLDAKMGMVQQALRQTAETEIFSDYLPGLKAPLLTVPTTADSSTDETHT